MQEDGTKGEENRATLRHVAIPLRVKETSATSRFWWHWQQAQMINSDTGKIVSARLIVIGLSGGRGWCSAQQRQVDPFNPFDARNCHSHRCD